MPDEAMSTVVAMTAKIVSAYVANNNLASNDLPTVIDSVYNALTSAAAPVPAAPGKPKPSAAQIRKSITNEGLISFIDGRSYKMLKRHLTNHGMTIAEYKTRFGLPEDYPTTAPAYSAKRSEFARAFGLGKATASGGIRPKAAG